MIKWKRIVNNVIIPLIWTVHYILRILEAWCWRLKLLLIELEEPYWGVMMGIKLTGGGVGGLLTVI